MKVDKPNPDLLPKFGRLYVSLATMKKGFLKGCRPIIGGRWVLPKDHLKANSFLQLGEMETTICIPNCFCDCRGRGERQLGLVP
jgi:hypothetical protein